VKSTDEVTGKNHRDNEQLNSKKFHLDFLRR